MGIADEYLVEIEAILVEESVDSEFCDDILRTEECVHLRSALTVADRFLVYDQDVFEYECGERFEVDFFKSYLSLNLFRKMAYYAFSNCCLHLWKLYRERYCEHKTKDGDNSQPEYF